MTILNQLKVSTSVYLITHSCINPPNHDLRVRGRPTWSHSVLRVHVAHRVVFPEPHCLNRAHIYIYIYVLDVYIYIYIDYVCIYIYIHMYILWLYNIAISQYKMLLGIHVFKFHISSNQVVHGDIRINDREHRKKSYLMIFNRSP